MCNLIKKNLQSLTTHVFLVVINPSPVQLYPTNIFLLFFSGVEVKKLWREDESLTILISKHFL